GLLADMYGLQNSFWLIVACEVYVLWYALYGSKPTQVNADPDLAAAS
ncbi:glucose/galactose MFS transporter, partial [Alteriqipengyuania lutimaris]